MNRVTKQVLFCACTYVFENYCSSQLEIIEGRKRKNSENTICWFHSRIELTLTHYLFLSIHKLLRFRNETLKESGFVNFSLPPGSCAQSYA